jgi:X-Pro dipeptidyl-peptidase (S15 family)
MLWQETRSWLLAAGYAVVAVDVRGTGASFGQWRAPWQPEECADSVQVVDWIISQPWSSQQVAQNHRDFPLSHRTAALPCSIRLLCACRAVLKRCLQAQMTWFLHCSVCFGASAMMVGALVACAYPLHYAWLCWCLALGSIKAVVARLLMVSVQAQQHCSLSPSSIRR